MFHWAANMALLPDKLLARSLKDVSRSFYLTLRLLPSAVRPQIGLAYLLARTTDTIADTELVPLEKRLKALETLRGRILGASDTRLDLADLARGQASSAERALLENCESNLALLQSLIPADLALVRQVLDTITGGQELDLRRFADASLERIIALGTAADLDDYTYRVAGCVGEFWTRICRAHLFPHAQLEEAKLLADGVRFGKGLQLVNILRDLPADLRQGRCYLPAEELSASGLKPADLLEPANHSRLRPVYETWLDRAEAHLRAGWAYTTSLPHGSFRVRLACALPVLIGIETLKLLRAGNVLHAAQRIKVSRQRVKQLARRALWLCIRSKPEFPG
jgi:farnesyl-diphosphate farnesyltransferase